MGVLSQTMGTRDRPVAYFLKPLDHVATGGQDAYGQLLWLPYWPGRQPS